jgi:hypothetical protein
VMRGRPRSWMVTLIVSEWSHAPGPAAIRVITRLARRPDRAGHPPVPVAAAPTVGPGVLFGYSRAPAPLLPRQPRLSHHYRAPGSPAPRDTTWMPIPCRSSSMNAASMQYEPRAGRPGSGRHDTAGATPATGALRTPPVTDPAAGRDTLSGPRRNLHR